MNGPTISDDNLAMDARALAEERLSLLNSAPSDRWIALSSDESRIVAEGETFTEVAAAAESAGESDPLIIRVPPDWTPRVL